ncbi:MAG: O-antigen ligase, partial [Pseudohongiellaceae bacterium]
MNQPNMCNLNVERTRARWFLVALVLVVPLAPLVPLAGAPIAVKQLLLLALAGSGVFWLFLEALRGRQQPALGTPTDMALGAWLAVALASAFTAQVSGLAQYDLGLYVGLGCSYVLAIKTLRCRKDVVELFAALLAGAVIIAVLGLLGFLRFAADNAPEISRSQYLSAGLFPHSYLAAQYVVPILAGALVALTEPGLSKRVRQVLALALLPLLGYLAVTGSRGAYLAVGAAVAVSGLLRALSRSDRSSRRSALQKLLARGLLVLGGLLLLAVAASLTGWGEGTIGHAVDRVLMLFDPEKTDFNFSRLDVWRGALAMVADHVLLGVGIGNFDTALPSYMAAEHTVPHAHNQFVHLAAEMGFSGLLAFLFLARHARHAGMKGAAYLVDDEQRRPLFHAALAALVASLTYFLWETPMLWVEAGSLVVILLAVMTRAGCVSRTQAPNLALGFAGLSLVIGLAMLFVPATSGYLDATRLGAESWERVEAAEMLVSSSAADSAEAREAVSASSEALLDEAAELLRQADAAFPYGSDFLALQAQLAMNRGLLDEALAANRQADARVPNTYGFNSAIGSLLMRMARPEEAIAPLRRAIIAHLGRSSAATYARLAQAYLQTARLEEAWYCYSTLI